MVTVILQHKVENFDKWKTAFDSDDTHRAESGMKGYTLGRLAGDPNTVVIISQWESAEAFQKLLQDPKLQEVMQAAGVIGAPTVQVLEGTLAHTY